MSGVGGASGPEDESGRSASGRSASDRLERTSTDQLRRTGADDLRLVVPVAVAWVVAAVLVGVPGSAGVVAAVSGLVAVSLLGVLLRRPRVRPRPRPRARSRSGRPGQGLLGLGVLVAGAVGLVAVAVAVGDASRVPGPVASSSAHRRVTATVVVDRDVAARARSYGARMSAVDEIDGLHVPIRVVPPVGTEQRRLAAGATLSVTGQLRREPAGSTAAFVLFARGTPVVVADPSGWSALTHSARAAFRTATARLPEPGAGLLRGLAIGDRSGIDDETTTAMETTSLTHLTAVSGSNCAVLVALVLIGGRVLRLPRTLRTALAAAVLLGFVGLVGADASIVRAAIMATVVLAVHLAGRPARGTPLVALAAVAMLVVDPWFARSFAFVLSVLATVGILVLVPGMTRMLARRRVLGHRVPGPVAALASVPIAAQVACWPVTVALSPSIPTYAVPANLLAEVLAPVGTVLGLAACVLAPFWPTGAAVVAAVAWVPATVIAGLARGFASMPLASVPWPEGVAGVVDAVLLCLGVVVVVLLRRRPVRAVAAAASALIGVVGVAAVVVPATVVRASLPRDWGIAACDVGQGDAVLMRSSGAVALIDTGDDEDLLQACLDLVGVRRIDLLVVSHFDRDHIGAVGAVAGIVDTAIVGPEGRSEDARVIETLRSGGASVRRASVGTGGVLGTLDWHVLWPPPTTSRGGNDASVVIVVVPRAGCGRCLSSVFLGDLGATAQRRLLRSMLIGGAVPDEVDVVKVAHHGSADQDPELYRALAARIGIVSVGADNTYGHPTASALDMLRDDGTEALRTDRSGTVVLSGGPGDSIAVWRERTDDEPTSSAARTLVPGVGDARSDTDPGRDAGTHPGIHPGMRPGTHPGAHAGTERNRWRSRRPRARRRRSTRCRGPASVPRRSSS